MGAERVPVVVLNFQGEQWLGPCLDSLREQDYPAADVWVIENGSTDGSRQLLATKYPWVNVVTLSRNWGFTGGYNRGLRELLKNPSTKYFAILSNDTRVTRGWLSALVAVIERYPRAWAVASKTLFLHEPDKIDTCGVVLYRDGSSQSRGHCETDRGQYEEVAEVFGASGVAFLVRRQAWEESGWFDERFFAYYEEVDLAWRMRLRGWVAYYAPRAVVYHIHSAYFVSYSPTKVYLTERNRIWMVVKNFPLPFLAASPYYTWVRYRELLSGMCRGVGAAARAAGRTPKLRLIGTVLRAWLAGLAGVPAFLAKRVRNQRTRVVSYAEINEWFRRFGVDSAQVALVDRERLDHAVPPETESGRAP